MSAQGESMSARKIWWLVVGLFLLGNTLLWPQQSFSQVSLTLYVDTLADNAVTDLNVHCTDQLTNNNCSLRQAIAKANASSGIDRITINFELITEGSVGSAPYIITTTQRLPPITRPNVTISADLLSGAPQVAINANASDAGLVLSGGGAIIEGLVIYGASNDAGSYRGSGIYISSADNVVRNCTIGLLLDNTIPPDNLRNRNGIVISGSAARNNQIGTANAPNTIAGNTVNGIVISNASQNRIQGNRIGVIFTGTTAARPNGGFGIQILSDTTIDPNGRAELNLVGGSTNAERNIIGANGLSGILISGSQTYTTTVASNLIGVNLEGESAFANGGDGLRIEDGAQATQIGSMRATQPLVISGNNGVGIRIHANGGASPANTNLNGYTLIGLSRGGSSARPNAQGGIYVSESAGVTTIGSASALLRIGGNGGPGIQIGPNASNVSVVNAFIGALPRDVIVPNGRGLVIDGASGIAITDSTIAANTTSDVQINNASNVTLDNNVIGLHASRRSVAGSAAAGITVSNSTNLALGLTTGNVIAGANGPGIDISGSDSVSITVRANIFGLRRDTTGNAYSVAAFNLGPAIRVNGASRVTIVSNVIGGNSNTAGIDLTDVQTATITQNRIGWIADPASSSTLLPRPAGVGIALTNVTTATLSGNLLRLNTDDGIRLTDSNTVTIDNLNEIEENGGDGVQIGGTSRSVVITGNRIRSNAGYGVLVTDSAQRVRVTQNQMSANGLGGIHLDNTTLYNGTGSDPDQTLNRPNHSIDPPFDLQLSQDGLITGRVFPSAAEREEDLIPISACAGCTIQVYAPKPDLTVPDGQGWQQIELLVNGVTRSEIDQVNASGVFNAQMINLPAAYPQLIFAATDRFGNTSPFRIFTPTIDIRLTPLDPIERSAAPGSTVRYRLQVENQGTLQINRLRLNTTGTLSGWTVNTEPNDRFNLPPGASRVLTVTLTLPSGAHPSIQVPITDTTTLSLTAPGLNEITQTLRTAVQALPVLTASPANSSATVLPADTYIYRHQITNNGNVTVPIDVSATTADLIGLDTYNTTVLTPTVTLAPGASAEIAVRITVPAGAQTTTPDGNPVRATTIITATPRGFGTQAITITDITTVGLRYSAELRSSYEQDVQAGREVVFWHTLRNTSNGRATFQLNFAASRGSTLIAFESATAGVTISDNRVTLDNVAGSGKVNQIVLRVRVRISELILPGTRETLRIWASIPGTTEPLSGAEVQDVAVVRDSSGILVPAVWIPLVVN
jgi:parallel beta-helix repeat protein